MKRTIALVALVCYAALNPRPALAAGDPSGCTGTASFNGTDWVLGCAGSTCGPSGGQACSSQPGGSPGATWTFCGCADGGGTPRCCFVAIDDGGTPWGNGFCKDSPVPPGGDPNANSSCPVGSDCNSVPTAGGDEEAKCEKKKIQPV